MPALERFVLHRLAELDQVVRRAYETYDYRRAFSALFNFCAVDLSSFYFDVRKDALYCDPLSSARRRACRTVMDELFSRLTAWLAPIMVFTMEEVWLSRFPNDDSSVHLRQFPQTPQGWLDETLAQDWTVLRRLRRAVTGALEVERREKRIGASLEAAPEIHVTSAAYGEALDRQRGGDGREAFLAELCIASGASLAEGVGPENVFRLEGVDDVAVLPARAAGVKCARSWKFFDPKTADPAYPDITPRDAKAVAEWDAAHG